MDSRNQEIEGQSSSGVRSVHQLAGLDDRERGFNRQVQINAAPGGLQASLRYERLKVEGEPVASEQEALQQLIRMLHQRGYVQLRSQQIFLNEEYLGSRELWIDYPDPEPSSPPEIGWRAWLTSLFKPRS